MTMHEFAVYRDGELISGNPYGNVVSVPRPWTVVFDRL